MDKHFRLRALTLAVSGALILAACGGGEGSASALSGTAAEGLAIANATLTARDAVGNTRIDPGRKRGHRVFPVRAVGGVDVAVEASFFSHAVILTRIFKCALLRIVIVTDTQVSVRGEPVEP